MAVLQNECYRLVTIGYLKKFIGQSGDKSSIQTNTGGYAIITRNDDTYCPTYAELTGGTIIQTWSQGDTPKSDRDGITVSSSAYLSGNYASNQCVDRHDLGLSLTRIEPFSIKLGQYTFDACSGETNVSVSYSYIRTTKTMSGCPSEESDITYTITSTTIDAPCSELVINKTLSNTASTIDCSTYKMFPNNDGSERTDKITASVNFRGTTYSSSVTTNQPATEGGYTHKVSERDVPIDIRELQASPSNYKVEYVSTNPPGCDITYTVTLGGTGSYGHYITYAYEKCGVVNTADTIEVMVSTATTTIPTVSNTLAGHTDDCCHGDTLVDTKTLTLSWSGLSVSRDFVAICQRCNCPTPPPEPTKCCQLNGPMFITCNGEAKFEIGECGCHDMVDLGLPSGRKWGRYPLGTDENYSIFKYYVWGHTVEVTTATTTAAMDQWEGDKIASATSYPYDTDVDDNSTDERDAILYLYPDSGYRMPTKTEALELLANTTQEWTQNYKGIAGLNGWVYTSIHNSETLFFPAAGELYPPDDTHDTWYPRGNGSVSNCWTRTGRWMQSNNCAAYRIVGLQGHEGGDCFVPTNGSSRKYGCLVVPVCDKG